MNNSTVMSPPADSISDAERYSAIAFCFLCGLVSLIGNLIMSAVIVRSKEMRSRFYCILSFLLISRASIGVMTTSIYSYRLLYLTGRIGALSGIECALISLFYFPLTFELVLLLFLAFDRVLALFAVFYYRKLTRRQATTACWLLFSITVVFKTSVIFVENRPFSNLYICGLMDFLGARASIVSQNIDLALVVLILCAYLGILIGLAVRLRHLRAASSGGGNENEAASICIRRQMYVMPTVRNIVLVHCIWTLTAKTLISLAPHVPAHVLNRFRTLGIVFVSMELVINIVVLLRTNEDVRRETLNVFRRVKVEPVSSAQQS